MMRSVEMRLAVLSLIVLLMAGVSAGADPSSRVGRINYLSGDVLFHPGTLDEWAAATLNYPLSVGDELSVGDNARAEVHVGSTAMRLNADTSFSFLNLDDSTVQVSISQGSLNVRLRAIETGETWEIDTPSTSVILKAAGSYRVDVQDSGGTRVAVRTGEAEVSAGEYAYPLSEGQAADVAGASSKSITIAEAGAQDDWDAWCAERDTKEDQADSSSYVAQSMTGYEDLDTYGTWSVSVDYGTVWIPTGVSADWAPYRVGQWAYVAPWGWTWIDSAPWGFAPFHYGRWVRVNGVWMWVPGSQATPVYAPALVVFIGGGSGNAGASTGWFPLGPREPYIPPYDVSAAYRQRINRGHAEGTDFQHANVADMHYVNRDTPDAFTFVSREAFVRSEQVRTSRIKVEANETARLRISGAPAGVTAQHESVLARSPGVNASAQRATVREVHRTVVVRSTPATRQSPFASGTVSQNNASTSSRQTWTRTTVTKVVPQQKAPQTQQRQPQAQQAPQAQQRQPQVQKAPQSQQTKPQAQQAPQTQQTKPQVQQTPQTQQRQPQTQQAPQSQQTKPQVQQQAPQTQQRQPQVQQAPQTKQQQPQQTKKKIKKRVLQNGVWVEVWVEE